MTSARWPARYEVRVDGVLDSRWAEWFADAQVGADNDQTIIVATLEDQCALRGLLERVQDLGLTVVAFRRLPPSPD